MFAILPALWDPRKIGTPIVRTCTLDHQTQLQASMMPLSAYRGTSVHPPVLFSHDSTRAQLRAYGAEVACDAAGRVGTAERCGAASAGGLPIIPARNPIFRCLRQHTAS